MGNSIVRKQTSFVVCEKCGKKLIERKANGIFHFVFGKSGENNSTAPVDLYIQGNLKIKCLRRSCGHWQVLTYLPNVFQSSENLEASDCEKKKN
jgi:hypothetical protein